MNENEIQALKDEMSALADKQLYKAMVILTVIMLGFSSLALIALSVSEGLAIIGAVILFLLFPFIIIPLGIRKGLKVTFNNWQALLYCVTLGILFVMITHMFSLIILLIIILPYYYLTNKPMFSNRRIKEIKNLLKEQGCF